MSSECRRLPDVHGWLPKLRVALPLSGVFAWQQEGKSSLQQGIEMLSYCTYCPHGEHKMNVHMVTQGLISVRLQVKQMPMALK